MCRVPFACSSVLALLMASGCAESTAPEANGPSGDAGADGREFCVGSSKLALGGELVVDVPVTTSLTPVSSCCDAAVVRLHAKSALGSDFDIGLEAMGPFEVGTHALGASTELTATLRPPGGELWTQPNVKGSVTITQAGIDLPTRLGLCLEVDDPADPLAGVRVWVDRVSIAPSAWHERFGIWLLSDRELSAADAAKLGLNAIETESHPILGLGDIGFYQASSYHVGWPPPFAGHQVLLDKVGIVPVAGRPFVVEADGERVYLGAFVTLVSSYAVGMPTIVIEQLGSDGFGIDDAYPSGSSTQADPRHDARILKVMANAQKLVP